MILFSALILLALSTVHADVSYLDASVPVPDGSLKPSPAEGAETATNPPSFRWMPEPGAGSYTLQYSQNREFAGKSTIAVEGLKLNMHHPAKTLKTGKWYWRYRVDGKASAWSSVRSFNIPKDAVEFVIPPVEEVLARIPKGRPRLFVSVENLDAVRQARFGDRKAIWGELAPKIEAALDKPLMAEPVPYPDGKWDVEIWRVYLRDSRAMGDTIEHLAFGYLITGDRKYADAAKHHILHLTTWDPSGPSSFRYNDEAAMPIILSVSRAYDWIYDSFTPEERRKVVDMMRTRGTEVYNHLRGMPYEADPYNSHATRVLKFLGQESISFLGEFPEAAEWFEYLTTIFACVYPPWGGTDGSYHEGPSYWSWYFGWALEFADALRSATGIDLHDKPFFRNTGYWALYCATPYSRMVPFGDGNSGGIGVAQKTNLYRLSTVYKDPYLRWYADSVTGSKLPNSLMMYLWHDDSVTAKAPTDLPPSRAFPDAGVAAMHSRLGEPKEDAFLLLKSDPYGSVSHAYAEQNSFYLQAFGEALAISSGYYPWYASEHHKQWVWQTKAHNSILVNGEGQVTRSPSSRGRITESLFSPQFDYACGDAVKAYGGRLDRFLRHVVFLRPDCWVMVDELAAKEPSTYDWLLHSWEKPVVERDRVTVSRGDARLLVQFAEPRKLNLSLTDQFTVPPENNLANQWHLTASTDRPSRQETFVTVLYPFKAGEEGSLPRIERIEKPGIRGVSLVSGEWEDMVLANRFEAPMVLPNFLADARIAALRRSPRGVSAVFLCQGRSLSLNHSEILSTTLPVTLSMQVGLGVRSLIANCAQETEIRLKIEQPARPKVQVRVVIGHDGRRRLVNEAPDPKVFQGTVKVDGRTLPITDFRYDHRASTITVKLSPGEHSVEIKVNHLPL